MKQTQDLYYTHWSYKDSNYH